MYGKSTGLLSVALAALTLNACVSASASEPPKPHPTIPADQQAFLDACENWDKWDKPAPPFKVYGNTWYVGTCGISAILITTQDGHAVIDSGTEAGADIVLANIRKLGFDAKDVKLLLNSHEHFDHVGGMDKLQQATGAMVVSSRIGIDVMLTGQAHPDDPQFGMHDAMEPIARGLAYDAGDAPSRLSQFGVRHIDTPGHTPGAVSWSWQSCDSENNCRTIVYADSLSPVSRDDYRFFDHPDYLDAYYASLGAIFDTECEILLTPHPSASDMLRRIEVGTLEDAAACRGYSYQIQMRLDDRAEKESLGEWPPAGN